MFRIKIIVFLGLIAGSMSAVYASSGFQNYNISSRSGWVIIDGVWASIEPTNPPPPKPEPTPTQPKPEKPSK